MRRSVVLALLVMSACKRDGDANPEQTTASASTAAPRASAVASASASAAEPSGAQPVKTLDDEVRELKATRDRLLAAGSYDELCAKSPGFPRAICTWVATRAAGKAAPRPAGDVLKTFFMREHIKRAAGRIIEGAGAKNRYEVTAAGYRRHCILETERTEYSTTGMYNLWVQESSDTEAVTTNSGREEQWVVLVESTLAADLMDLAKTANELEGQATARSVIDDILTFRSYEQMKHEFDESDAGVGVADAGFADAGIDAAEPAPDAAPPAATAAATASAPASPPVEVAAAPTVAVPAPTVAAATAPPAAAPGSLPPVGRRSPAPAPAKKPNRQQCLSTCIAGCRDDAACERACVSKC